MEALLTAWLGSRGAGPASVIFDILTMAMPVDLRPAGSRCARCCTVGGAKGGNIKKWVLRAMYAVNVYEEAGASRELLDRIKPQGLF